MLGYPKIYFNAVPMCVCFVTDKKRVQACITLRHLNRNDSRTLYPYIQATYLFFFTEHNSRHQNRNKFKNLIIYWSRSSCNRIINRVRLMTVKILSQLAARFFFLFKTGNQSRSFISAFFKGVDRFEVVT